MHILPRRQWKMAAEVLPAGWPQYPAPRCNSCRCLVHLITEVDGSILAMEARSWHAPDVISVMRHSATRVGAALGQSITDQA